jgi:hypothetical protein
MHARLTTEIEPVAPGRPDAGAGYEAVLQKHTTTGFHPSV